MSVEVSVPEEYQGSVIGAINKRQGTIMASENKDGYAIIDAEVSLNDMFGYSSELRASTQVCPLTSCIVHC